MKTILKNESIILLLDQVFQQLVKLLHKRTKTLEVTTCNLTIIEKSNKFDKNGSLQKQFDVQLWKESSLGTNVGVSKHIMCEQQREDLERPNSTLDSH